MSHLPELREAAFPFVVSGPSGVGKTVLCNALLARLPWTIRSVSATTRPPRGEEIDGDSYFFYKEEAFRRAVAEGRMAEHAEVHGRLYGTPKEFLDEKLSLGKSVVLNIDVQGGLAMKRSYPESVLVFLLPPSWEALEARLRQRKTDTPEQVEARLVRAREEVGEVASYDYVVINDDLERAVEEIRTIALAERARVSRRLVAGATR